MTLDLALPSSRRRLSPHPRTRYSCAPNPRDRGHGRTEDGLQLQWEGESNDAELLASLDLIDSDGHYEADNLHVVCRFVNRWKGADPDEEFRRPLDLVRGSS